MDPIVLYKDSHIAVVDKPAGLLVHATKLTPDAPPTLHDWLERTFEQKVYPVHRLDRPTSGVMVFAFSSGDAKGLSSQFSDQSVHKVYLALVRGHVAEEVLVDHALSDKIDGKKADKLWPARSLVVPLARTEIPVAVDRYPTSRYSVVQITPITGRTHQIRRHLKFLNHPIIGDVNHGTSIHNRYFESRYGLRRLYLDCFSLKLSHPKTHEHLSFTRQPPPEFMGVIRDLFTDFQFSINA